MALKEYYCLGINSSGQWVRSGKKEQFDFKKYFRERW